MPGDTTGQRRPGAVDLDLTGVLAVVIGASGGIGQAIAAAYADAGATVVATARDAARLRETAALVESSSGTLVPMALEITDPQQITDFATAVLQTHGTPTILVNSAGIMIPKPALEITVEDWDTVHLTQLRGPFLCSQAFAAAMGEAGYGKIINLSSTWAVTVAHGRSVYSAAKAGLGHLTSALALEWAPLGIRVNAIAPAATLTPAASARMRAHPGREEALSKQIPLGRLATPEDIAGAALFLASSSSDFITGETILVDGGWRTAK